VHDSLRDATNGTRALHFGAEEIIQRPAARSEGDKNFYESKCATLERQIDSLVYELYDLTSEEIAIVEGSGQ